MDVSQKFWSTPSEYLSAVNPDVPVHFFAPARLQGLARKFLSGFPGLTSYAVKANPDPMVLQNLIAAGVRAFDVASTEEIHLVQSLCPQAALHYNNPMRAPWEVAAAKSAGVASFSVDSNAGLDVLLAEGLADGVEVSIRLKLSVTGGAYNFGSKFGADPDTAVALLQRAEMAGFIPSVTFHPGTQCEDPDAWESYIGETAKMAKRADVRIARLNVGGGFPARRSGNEPRLKAFFAAIAAAAEKHFGSDRPDLVCEPGRAMVADAFSLAARIKGVNDAGDLYLNDGIYGGLSEMPLMGVPASVQALGRDFSKNLTPRTVFGPTCDSLDVLPQPVELPDDIGPDDYLIFPSMGAYVGCLATRFNGYGNLQTVTVMALE